uniref:F-box domain-containing protein n=1 Tax=Steinernema glaseri TaxID=37863 RepID=A0A1I7YP97_9BILA
MDTVPIAFCQHLCDILLWKDSGLLSLSEVDKLSGNFGKCARFASHRTAQFFAYKMESETVYYRRRKLETPEEINAVPKKFVRFVWITLHNEEDQNVCRALVKRFPYAFFTFWLQSPSITEAWVNFVCSLKKPASIEIWEGLDSHAASLFQKIIAHGKITELKMIEDIAKDGTLELLKSILCQDQFKELTIFSLSDNESWKSDVISELLQFWSENSEKFRGKSLLLKNNCKGGVEQLQDFVLRRAASRPTDVSGLQEAMEEDPGTLAEPWKNTVVHENLQMALEVCSKEECDSINKYYRYHHTQFAKPSCVYKYEEGEGEERRRLYISFDCAGYTERYRRCKLPASPSGNKDAGLMRSTDLLHVLFA